jgi:hypothetical protein
MSSTAAKSPKPMRRAVGAVLIPVERLDEWYAQPFAVPGLNVVELGVLAGGVRNSGRGPEYKYTIGPRKLFGA